MRLCCIRSLAINSNRRCNHSVVVGDPTCYCVKRPSWFDHPFWFATRLPRTDTYKGGVFPAILIHPYSFTESDEAELVKACDKHTLFYKKDFFVNVWHEDTIPILIHWHKPGVLFQIEGVPVREG
jgi:hypothetical protein